MTNIFRKSFAVLIAILFCNAGLKAQGNKLTVHNKTARSVSFVRYDEYGNYQHYPVGAGKTEVIYFDHDYLNFFPVEDDADVPYFFFPGDEVSVTGVKDKFYSFESTNKERCNELLLSQKIFSLFAREGASARNDDDFSEQANKVIDSVFANYPDGDISQRFKDLARSFYFYKLLGEKIKYNSGKNTRQSFEQYWQQPYNNTLQSYILSFRSYTLNYLPRFIAKENLLNAYDSMFNKFHKEIAMYTVMHMSYYKDKPWFRKNYDVYRLLSKNREFYEKLSYFKLTDELAENADNMMLIGSAKDTLSLKALLAKLKGKVVLVDLWASWCAPCIAQIPFADELSKTFDKKEFQVLYLSLDRELHLFTRFSEKKLQGKLNYNIVGNFESPFAKLNKIKSIPRYMIINKQGIIVNDRAPFPSNNTLKEMIEKYL